MGCVVLCFFFFFNDTATTEIYTLSLHDALPISGGEDRGIEAARQPIEQIEHAGERSAHERDRKSTRLNSSHGYISYAVFCLKKKKTKSYPPRPRAQAEPTTRPHLGRPRRRAPHS